MDLTIGALSRETGVKIPTIRYYESISLMPQPPRTAGNRRLYGRAHLERLNFIRQARDLGFSIEAITTLIQLAGHPDQPCADVDRLAREHRGEIRRKIRQLEALEAELSQLIGHCAHGTVSECGILTALSQPAPSHSTAGDLRESSLAD
ncbi:MerR family transcriptional regulator [Pedomonas mirosovicensis]|uniref:MerR family transcriptional regulator n=1 Tax=Pedomonas mirosovicensis TaxID=2908641 RepID=UPI002167B59D|nr:helix-turn-helix domain-containing protein [Pedomonas mirosovicensis]MCH8684602.1 helix-turn-helix domain-containing protein [Pedomonas mirosovicensis]